MRDLGPEPTLGHLAVHFVEASYEDDFLLGAERMNTYCVVWLLEKVKWRRRKSRVWGDQRGQDPMRPQWDEEFEFEDVRDDAKAVVDVWNVVGDGSRDQFIGKVTLRLADLMIKPAPAWHELVPGRLCLQLSWTPLSATGDPSGEPVPLTLAPTVPAEIPSRPAPAPPPPSKPAYVEPPKPAAPPPAPAPAPAPSRALAAALKPVDEFDDADEVDEIEEIGDYADDDDEFEDDISPVEPARAAQSVAPAEAKPGKAAANPTRIEYFEYTHRGGTGNGPKENQDAYFTIKFDDQNYIFAVLDGHGGENGRIASQAASEAMQHYFRANFAAVKATPEAAMTKAFELAHEAIHRAIKNTEDVFEKDGMLVMEVDPDEWPLGYDAVDGGSTASVAAVIDGETLVYAAVGDSCSIFAVPAGGGKPPVTIELLPEHSPTNLNEWATRLHSSGIHVLYDHPDMFDGPENMLHVFCRDASAPSGWRMDEDAVARADEAGCGFKTERGDRAAMLVTPEEGKFSQMMLGVTRSLGDFYHQRYGVTWRPEVMTKPLAELMGGAPEALICLASDGFWDHWAFEDAMEDLCVAHAPGGTATTRQRAHEWFENTRERGAEAFGDHADNLTSIVANISLARSSA